MKVYAVFYTFWDDYELWEIFSTKEKAEEYIESSRLNGKSISDRLSIEEYEVK